MAKSGQYTKVRRVVMQAVMAVVLAGTVALAALVSRKQAAEFEVRLTQTFEVGTLRVRLPEDWEISPPQERADPQGKRVVAISATEPGPEQTRRTITVVQEFPAQGSAKMMMFKLAPPWSMSARRGKFEHFDFLGQQGFIDEVVGEVVPPEGGDPQRLAKTYAVTVLPTRWAVLVQIDGQAAFGPSTRRVLEQVVRGMEILPPKDVRKPATEPAQGP